MLHSQILTVALGQLINSIVLIAQGGIHQHACLDIGSCTGIFHLIGDEYQAVLVGRNVQQGQGLSKGQIIDTPDCHDAAVGGGQLNIGTGHTEETVITAEDIVPGLAAAGNTEGGIGRIEILIGIEQEFIVVGFLQFIAFDSVHKETAVFFGDLNRQVSVGDLLIARIAQFRCHDFHRQHAHEHDKNKSEGQ